VKCGKIKIKYVGNRYNKCITRAIINLGKAVNAVEEYRGHDPHLKFRTSFYILNVKMISAY